MDNEKNKRNSGWNNLIPPVPGENRNPKGRGKGVKNRATELKKLLEIKRKVKNPLKGGKEETLTVEQSIELKLVHLALQGNIRAITLVGEKMFGKIPQDINLGGQQENPVIVDNNVTKLSKEDLLQLKYGPNWREIFYKSDDEVGEEEPE